jgi:hypothetical protein
MTESGADPRSFDSDFYEEDEPIEKIMAIFERGPKGVTAPPYEAADALVTVNPSRWLLVARTAGRYVGRAPVARHEGTVFDLHVSGAA